MTDRIPLTEENLVNYIYNLENEGMSMVRETLFKQILDDHKFYHTFHNSNVYSFTEKEMKSFRKQKEKLEKVKKWLEYSLDGFTYPNEYNNLLKLNKILKENK